MALGSGEDSPQTLQGALPPVKLAAGLDPRASCHPLKPPRGHLGTSGCWPRSRPEVLLPPAPSDLSPLDHLSGDPGDNFLVYALLMVTSVRPPHRHSCPHRRSVLLAVTPVPPGVPSRGARCRCL